MILILTLSEAVQGDCHDQHGVGGGLLGITPGILEQKMTKHLRLMNDMCAIPYHTLPCAAA